MNKLTIGRNTLVIAMALVAQSVTTSRAQHIDVSTTARQSEHPLRQSLPYQGHKTNDSSHRYFMPAGQYEQYRSITQHSQTQASNDFGYASTQTTFNWADAETGGTVNTISGNAYESNAFQRTPITLPFVFKYYETTYSQIYIGQSGYIAFDDLYVLLVGRRISFARNERE